MLPILSLVLAGASFDDVPNVLLVVLDDISNEYVACYGEGPDLDQPPTPHLDALATQGMRFTHAYANPVCSATRACLATGRYSFRTGVGGSTGDHQGSTAQLSLDETTYPEVMPGAHFLLGKWHLGTRWWPFDPILHGFDALSGSKGNLRNYFGHKVWTSWRWAKQQGSAEYSTRWIGETTASFLASDPPGPWTLAVHFHAVHNPVHWPPGDLHSYGDSQGNRTNHIAYQAMVESLDTALGWIMAEVDLTNTWLVVLADNGTRGAFSYPPGEGKKTMYEGGINVPLLVAGPGVPAGTVTPSLVSAVDVYATLLDLAGVTSTAEDAVSFLPVLLDPTTTTRDTVYTEYFNDDGTTDLRAARGTRYKLTWDRLSDQIRFYDLDTAPAGQDGPPVDPSVDQGAYDALWALVQNPG